MCAESRIPPKTPDELALGVAAADEAACAGATGDAAVAKSAKSDQTVSYAYFVSQVMQMALGKYIVPSSTEDAADDAVDLTPPRIFCKKSAMARESGED